MSISSDTALDILGLPTYASVHDIVQRYLTLSIRWTPETSNIEEFRNITLAFLKLIYSEKSVHRHISLGQMYNIFQYVFSGWKSAQERADCRTEPTDGKDLKCYCNSNEEEKERQAHLNAAELILEEEREKQKAEKKKAKKKRRKEKKKQQKSEDLKSDNDESSSGAQKMNDTASDTEENIDPSSAFVAVIAKKKNKHISIKQGGSLSPSKANSKDSPVHSTMPVEDAASVVLRSRELALRGNEVASLGHFSEAASLFSESIRINSSDHRFYGNRSYCYDRTGQYEKALKDAEKAISLCPTWPKGHFRKGRALLGLQKYALAEDSFVQVLKYDNDCIDAISELRKVKMLQIMVKGYTKEQAEAAICEFGSVKEALESLQSGHISKVDAKDVDIFISDDENDEIWKYVTKSKQSELYDIKMDPKNPESHNSLWIGNVQSDITEKKLTEVFSKYGELINVRKIPEKFCAFVNYKNTASPGKAMAALQGYKLSGSCLTIRFPNLPGESQPKKKPVGIPLEASKSNKGVVNGDECYYWRTTGCVYGTNCRHKHKKENKGIDKKKWMG